MKKESVLFICTGNSVRSQMAEALLRHFGGEWFEAHSAGTNPIGLHHYARQVLEEIGIPAEGQESKHIDVYLNTPFDYVIRLCEVAAINCPNFPGKNKHINWYMDDPIRVIGDEERRLTAFRITRNILKDRILKFIQEKTPTSTQPMR